ncbi:MAG: relaxase/mobilization nuclease domain-containing protein [Clostridiales bacterium]|nr:relaxase/mobilization nuclease domain-containing protein [Clostridiales bacterium]
MAVTKTKHITTTLNKAIDYICNEKKTDEGILISSFACAPETADLEFSLTNQKYNRSGKCLAHHLIQSFKPGEVTPEDAHHIGEEWAQSILGGKYEFVLSTHIDRGHIHNHLIFNATSFTEGRKYNDCKRTLRFRMKESDRICREHGLSVIEEKSGRRGVGKYEYEHIKRGTSWKEKIRIAIDDAVNKASDWDEFVTIMELKGCDCERNSYGIMKLRLLGQERFVCINSLGEKYSEDIIRDRIERKDYYKNLNQQEQSNERYDKKRARQYHKKNVSLIVDLQNNLQAQQSRGYRQALEINNVNQLFKTIAFLEQNDLASYTDFLQKYNSVKEQYDMIRNKLAPLEQQSLAVSEKIQYCQNFFKVAKNARMAIRNPAMMGKYKNEVAVYNSCLRYFKENNISIKGINLKELLNEQKQINATRREVANQLRALRTEMKNWNVIKANIDTTLGYADGQEKQNDPRS